MSGRRADGRDAVRVRSARPGTAPSRPRHGPLVAAAEPRAARRRAPESVGPLRGLVRRYGWRAYAIPFLTLATLVALVDVAADGATSTDTTGAAGVAAQPTPSVLPMPVTDVEPGAPAQGDAEPSELPAPAADATTYVEQGAGTVSVVDGSGPVHGTGPLRRFVVEVEDGIDVDGGAFAAAVEATLGDPRSWGNGGRMSFQRVGVAEAAASQYEFKVTLVSPGSMERYCPGVGTGGYTSCRYGERAVINLARWATAVPHYDGDIPTYRQYVVNHEVGHALGQGHVDCPAPGQLAPVMVQQTLSLDGCARNAWPYP
ncbi:DUF3152 domain-containing protein [Candidatus Blastococcus massiliensis]|uniref:DUF3152 domain-containing protein n=1 Tax=Candidatus Blastococcus massiliensis TaxID=1470358 RepID=UPI0004AC5D64|nr:DUF3152 domain-containing protein [Candidatus Blastococcus massiliensis]